MRGEDDLVTRQQGACLDPALRQVGPLLDIQVLGNRVGALEVGAEEDMALVGDHPGGDREVQLPLPPLAASIEIETDHLVQLGVIELRVAKNRGGIVIGGRRVHQGARDILVPDRMARLPAEADQVSLPRAIGPGNAEEIFIQEVGSLEVDPLLARNDLSEVPDLFEPLALENALRDS